MFQFEQIAEAVLDGNAKRTKELAEQALAEGVAPEEIVNQGLVVGMAEVGRLFKENEIYVPEVLIAARAMNTALSVLEPLLADKDIKSKGDVVIGTVKGDMHDIGKNLVAMMLKGAGYKIIDLGVDVSPEAFVQAVKAQPVDIVAMSALLTTTMVSMKDTIQALQAAGVRDQVKIMIGGAPITQAYCDQIGADGYSADAGSAVDLANALMQG